MSGLRGFSYLFGKGNLPFFSLLKPLGQGFFSNAFSKALTVGTVASTGLGLINTAEGYRKGDISGKEAVANTGALFFGCLGGGGTVLSITYSSVSSYLTLFSLIERRDNYRAQNPGQPSVPDDLIKGSDYHALVAPPMVTLCNEITKLTGSNAGSYVRALSTAYTLLSADKSRVRALLKSYDANVLVCQETSPETLNNKLAAWGDQISSTPIENAPIECGNIN
jgi:hypothetical protein